MRLDVKLPVTKRENPEGLSSAHIIYTWIQYGVGWKYQQGISGLPLRVWARLQDKFDVALDKKLAIISLDAAEVDFLKSCVCDQTLYPPAVAKVAMVLIDMVQNEQVGVSEEERSI